MRRRAAWVGYDEMAATGVYGALLNETGELSLPPDGENEAAFFCSTLAGRDRVLDLGCGPGFPSVVLASSARTVCGIDAAPAMLGKAKEALARLGISNVRLIRAFADKLPFVACAFDGIAVCGTLGSLGNPGAVLRELARVAAPGALVASLEQDFRRRLSGTLLILTASATSTMCWTRQAGLYRDCWSARPRAASRPRQQRYHPPTCRGKP